MTKLKNISLAVLAILIALPAMAARAQSNNDATPGDVRREARQLASDMDDPNFDWTKAPKRLQQYFTDFRTVMQNMQGEDRFQFAQDVMQQMMPTMQRHQDQIQKAIQLAFLMDLQQPLGCSDDEFSALVPLLQNVATAQQEVQGGRQRFARFFGQQSTIAATTPVEQATNDLQTALDDANSSGELIQTKLDALRHAKDGARQNLRAAQDTLRQVLTVRQEAVLVTRGFLD